MLHFTALHRLLGYAPGPLTDAMLDEAIAQNIAETDDLDWKGVLPPAKGLNDTDYPKDIAAMANSGGGVIVYGVTEDQKKANGRKDVGELAEVHARSLRSAAVTAISPPVFGLDIVELGGDGARCVAIMVPGSVDGPHLIYKGEYFGAPVRNDADTVWMKERQVEAAYRARFEERRHSHEALDRMVNELSLVTEVEARAWLIAVARPRGMSTPITRWSRTEAQQVFEKATEHAVAYFRRGVPDQSGRPFDIVSTLNPRTGLRRWVAGTHRTETWREATASVHFDGSASVAFALGGHRTGRDSSYEAWEFDGASLSGAIADFMGLIRALGSRLDSVDYEIRIAIAHSGPERLIMHSADQFGFVDAGTSVPMHAFLPIDATIEVSADDARYLHQVREVIRDCLNQGGISVLRGVAECDCDECAS